MNLSLLIKVKPPEIRTPDLENLILRHLAILQCDIVDQQDFDKSWKFIGGIYLKFKSCPNLCSKKKQLLRKIIPVIQKYFLTQDFPLEAEDMGMI